MATLTIVGCSVDTSSITISFSDKVDATSLTGPTSATNPGNYTIYDPPNFPPGTNPPSNITVAADGQTVTIPLAAQRFSPGDFVLIAISNIALAANPGTPALIDDPVSIARQVPGTDPTTRTTKDVEDAIAYPVLTEEIGYRPSPVGIPVGGGGGITGGGGGTSNLGQVALKAVSDVLGWKANTADAKGFVGALTQSFTLTEVEGHVESTWTPRTYAVQTDLGGGITGAQASLYTRAKDALDQSLSLLDGLYPLDPEADPEYVKALREMARSQMTEIVKEFGVVGLPSILRIDTYFGILLGQNPAQLNSTPVQFDPDEIEGTLGTLRDTYGIFFAGNPFNNSVEDEQDITNFRVISDYMTSLMQSWIANRQFFVLAPNTPAFFGTQLVLISRQFNVIAETVNEVRFTLDSVFIGPNERQTLLLEFADPSLHPMFLEDVLDEVEKFVTEEGPRLLRDGGKISVTNNVLPVVQSLQNMVEQAHSPTNIGVLPDGFRTARVRNSLDDLDDQLEALINLTEQVEQQVPPAEGKLNISGITTRQQGTLSPFNWAFSIFGEGFDPETTVTINSSLAVIAQVEFFSSQRIDAIVTSGQWGYLARSPHSITVENSNGETVVLPSAFTIDASGAPILTITRTLAASKVLATKAAAVKGRRPALAAAKAAPGKAPPEAPAPAPNVSALQSQIQQLQKGHGELQKGLETVLSRLEEISKKISRRRG